MQSQERTLNLEIPGLWKKIYAEIYLASSRTNWGSDPGWKYREGEKPGTYTLTASLEEGMPFKHFVLSKSVDRRKVAKALEKGGYKVTGTGDESPKPGMWRTWFLLRESDGFEVEGSGVWANNVWS